MTAGKTRGETHFHLIKKIGAFRQAVSSRARRKCEKCVELKVVKEEKLMSEERQRDNQPLSEGNTKK